MRHWWLPLTVLGIALLLRKRHASALAPALPSPTLPLLFDFSRPYATAQAPGVSAASVVNPGVAPVTSVVTSPSITASVVSTPSPVVSNASALPSAAVVSLPPPTPASVGHWESGGVEETQVGTESVVVQKPPVWVPDQLGGYGR